MIVAALKQRLRSAVASVPRRLALRLYRTDAVRKLVALLDGPDHRLEFRVLVSAGSEALAVGRNPSAIKAYRRALQFRPDDVLLRRQLGITEFLTGRYREAQATFASVHHQLQFEKMRWGVSESPYRVLDDTWLAAIGHVAFLDTHIKSVKLGWATAKTDLLVYDEFRPPAGWPLFKYFSSHIKIVPTHRGVTDTIDKIIAGDDPVPEHHSARDYRRVALSEPFWYGQTGSGDILWFAPFGAAVEAAWKAEGRPALFSLTDAERKAFRRQMAQAYGLPEDAWFMLLHVREPGFHARWHKAHVGTRNADIRSYDQVIDFVTGQGGWVVRGGDPSMTPIAPRDRVIDYATHPLRSPEVDIHLCAECAYFVGTNSGFSLVPPVFGKRCALTNWSPLGIPNWYLDDIYIPKLIRKRSENRYLTFAEMYGSFAGWSQFARDFERSDLVVEDNSPEDLRAAVEELHGEVFGSATEPTAEDRERLRRFNEITVQNGGYVGSRMGFRFMEKYRELL